MTFTFTSAEIGEAALSLRSFIGPMSVWQAYMSLVLNRPLTYDEGVELFRLAMARARQ